MKTLKYFIEFLFIKLFFLIFKLIGYKKCFKFRCKNRIYFWTFFRSKKIIKKIFKIVYQKHKNNDIDNLIKKMWENYGRIFSEYMFIEKFRSKKLEKFSILMVLKY